MGTRKSELILLSERFVPLQGGPHAKPPVEMISHNHSNEFTIIFFRFGLSKHLFCFL